MPIVVCANVLTLFLKKEDGMENFKKPSNNEERAAFIEQWKASGVSVRQWCARWNISEAAFYYWKKALSPTYRTIMFTEIAEKKQTDIRVECNGIAIRIKPGFDEDALVSFLKAVRRIGC